MPSQTDTRAPAPSDSADPARARAVRAARMRPQTATPAPAPSDAAAPARARRGFPGRKIAALVIVIAGVAADLSTKSWMQSRLGMNPDTPSESEQIEVIPGFLR